MRRDSGKFEEVQSRMNWARSEIEVSFSRREEHGWTAATMFMRVGCILDVISAVDLHSIRMWSTDSMYFSSTKLAHSLHVESRFGFCRASVSAVK